ncbi:Hypothetical_protein [Hexamita inflata]|uniref:Hypothetical_protein n=1 Tax=Hexamita inflata TaxID=28002 RepID=A0AA86RNK7_9EUKA|nr:Hypothetical protein HINF_LOCUS65486 [Hexamita inflata]
MQITNTSDSAIYCSFYAKIIIILNFHLLQLIIPCNQYILTRDSCWIKQLYQFGYTRSNARQSYVICVCYCKQITAVSMCALSSIEIFQCTRSSKPSQLVALPPNNSLEHSAGATLLYQSTPAAAFSFFNCSCTNNTEPQITFISKLPSAYFYGQLAIASTLFRNPDAVSTAVILTWLHELIKAD